MSIKIDESRCVGCARCVEVCPGNLIKLAPLAVGAGARDESAATEAPAVAGTSATNTAPSAVAAFHAHIKHPRDCWGCTSCVKACPKQAISFYLGADIGGRGAQLTVETHGAVRVWRVKKRDGTVQEITVDASESNKY